MQFLIALDQLLNTLIWVRGDGFGDADETMSARAWRLRKHSYAYRIVNSLFFWQPDHCLHAYESEMKRKQLPKEYSIEN